LYEQFPGLKEFKNQQNFQKNFNYIKELKFYVISFDIKDAKFLTILYSYGDYSFRFVLHENLDLQFVLLVRKFELKPNF